MFRHANRLSYWVIAALKKFCKFFRKPLLYFFKKFDRLSLCGDTIYKNCKQMERYVVIMAGGAGERFWPLSRKSKPKHLWNVVGGRRLPVVYDLQ